MPEASDKLEALRSKQYEFAAHLRDPEQNPAPDDVEDRRMGVYRELFFNNVRKFLGGHFPIAEEILGEEAWAALIRDYYRDHISHSPLFPDMPREFLSYLSEERANNGHAAGDPPFLYELAHYEWVEAGLMLAPDPESVGDINASGDLLEGHPTLVQPAWLLAYQYAVNEIGPDNIPQQPADQPLHYLIMRNVDDEVKFIKLNIVSARLYELLKNDSALTGRGALEKIAAELNHENPAAVVESGAKILERWRSSGIVSGTTK